MVWPRIVAPAPGAAAPRRAAARGAPGTSCKLELVSSQPVVYKWPARLVVMRHAESEANYHRQYLARIDSPLTHLQLADRDVDVPLTERGRKQADEVGRALAAGHPPFDVAYVSP